MTCVVQNDQQLGAIKLNKISSKAAATALAGAHFRICTNGTDNGAFTTCTAAKTGSDDLNSGTATFVCVDNLPFGDYYVSEKSAPAGYAIDDALVHKVTVSTNAKCSDTTYVGQSYTFKDTPLTDLTITATSEVTGGTKSAITCTDSGSATVTDDFSDQTATDDTTDAEGFSQTEQVDENLCSGAYSVSASETLTDSVATASAKTAKATTAALPNLPVSATGSQIACP